MEGLISINESDVVRVLLKKRCFAVCRYVVTGLSEIKKPKRFS